MDFSRMSSEAAANITFLGDYFFTEVINVTENFVEDSLNHSLTTHTNVSYDLAKNLTNVTEESLISLMNATDDGGVCAFIISNVTSGNVTTTVASYNPATCGVYGSYPAIKPLLIVILLCFTLWAIFGNGCLVGVIATDKNMQEPGNIFLCAMAFNDVAQSFMYTPIAIDSLVHGEYPGGTCCRIQAFFGPFQGSLAIYLQTCLWICRYVHIVCPYKYQALLTRGRLALAMTLCFVLALAPPLVGLARFGTVPLWSMPAIKNMGLDDIAKPVSIMMPCTAGGIESNASVLLCILAVVISCIFASLIYREARKSQKKHDKKQAWIAQADKLENKLKAVKTLGIVVGVQWATWIPVLVVAVLDRFGAVTTPTIAVYKDIVFVIWQTSTFSDSIVYAFRNRIYRRALAKIYRKMRIALNDI